MARGSATKPVRKRKVRMPVCPYCKAEMVRAYRKDDDGVWVAFWMCECESPNDAITTLWDAVSGDSARRRMASRKA